METEESEHLEWMAEQGETITNLRQRITELEAALYGIQACYDSRSNSEIPNIIREVMKEDK
jgi:hypothetical protein